MAEPLQQEPQQEQQEQQELDYENPNEDQGNIRWRLRDRNLLKKRKAEAEEKETSQWDFGTESPGKRGRSGAKRGRRRGRPWKTEPAVITNSQNDAALDQETPAAVPVPVFSEAIPGQTPSSLTWLLETQPVSAAPAVVPVFEPLNPTPQAPVPPSELDVNTAPIPVQDLAPAPDAVPIPPAFQEPPQVKPIYTEPQSKAALDQILIEDLGPDEEEDLGPSQDKQVEENLNGKPLISAPEPNTLSSPPPPPQEYVPDNSF